MAIIKDTLVDLAGGPDWSDDAYAEVWSPDELRDVAGDTATNKRLKVPITETGIETEQLKAGSAMVRLYLGPLRPSLGPFPIVVPDDTAEHRLVELVNEFQPTDPLPSTLPIDRVTGLSTVLDGRLSEEGLSATYAPTSIIPRTAGKKAVGQGELFFNVQDYGATGDGTTDDTAAFQAAINAASAAVSSGEFAGAGRGAVYIPRGSYCIGNLQLKANVTIRGSHFRAVTIIPTATSGFTFGTSGLTTTNRMTSVCLEGFTIGPTSTVAGLSGTRPAAGGIDLSFTLWCSIKSVYIHNIAGIGIKLTETYDLNTFDVHLLYVGVDSNSPAVLMAGDAADTCNANHHFGMRIERCPVMLRVTGVDRAPVNNQFVGCKFEWNVAGQPTTTSAGIWIEHGLQNTFTSCMFVSDSVTYPLIRIGADTGSMSAQGTRFIGCDWNANAATDGWAMETTAKALDVSFVGCHLRNFAKGFVFNDSTRASFTNLTTFNALAPVIVSNGAKLSACEFLETRSTTSGSHYIVQLNANAMVAACFFQGVTSGNKPNGISQGSNCTVTGTRLNQIVVGTSFFGTGSKWRANRMDSVTTSFAGSANYALNNSIEGQAPVSLTHSRALEDTVTTALRTALVSAGLAYDNTVA
ncbi:pectin lyase domain tail protein [Rhodococcus phage Mbo4]|uniref:Pectin lyase domain tail protein n=2 Tax=root TaxID=1 RepID=A0A9E7LH74_9CAUD|nr:glycoside hydrolase [Rhodococcus opacus]YP_010755929.1 pectin lyase domain tail protein [Rhodococcus phage Mbo4]EKT83029.1 glycoside hydrolase family protein [Rhodococcus opacus M213]URG17514.1 pectin lyase domain tail protein [Rhodococcus phage Mbo4]